MKNAFHLVHNEDVKKRKVKKKNPLLCVYILCWKYESTYNLSSGWPKKTHFHGKNILRIAHHFDLLWNGMIIVRNGSTNFTYFFTVPSSPPMDVQCFATSSKSLFVSWNPPPREDRNGILREYGVFYRPLVLWQGR